MANVLALIFIGVFITNSSWTLGKHTSFIRNVSFAMPSLAKYFAYVKFQCFQNAC